jgi:hypothetical protein
MHGLILLGFLSLFHIIGGVGALVMANGVKTLLKM